MRVLRSQDGKFRKFGCLCDGFVWKEKGKGEPIMVLTGDRSDYCDECGMYLWAYPKQRKETDNVSRKQESEATRTNA